MLHNNTTMCDNIDNIIEYNKTSVKDNNNTTKCDIILTNH